MLNINGRENGNIGQIKQFLLRVSWKSIPQYEMRDHIKDFDDKHWLIKLLKDFEDEISVMKNNANG